MSDINGLVRELVGGNPDVMGAFVFDADGRVEASSGAPEELLGAAVALFVPMRDLLERTAASLGCGEMQSALVLGATASIGVSDVDGVRAVAVLGAEGAPTGSLLQESQWLARRLREGGGS